MATVVWGMAVREVMRQSVTLRTSADFAVFCSSSQNKMRIRKDGETSELRWTKMQRASGAIWRESLVP